MEHAAPYTFEISKARSRLYICQIDLEKLFSTRVDRNYTSFHIMARRFVDKFYIPVEYNRLQRLNHICFVKFVNRANGNLIKYLIVDFILLRF